MRDVRPGPRIGMVHDLQFHEYFLDNGKYPDEGIKRTAYSNSGMMLLKPGAAKSDAFFVSSVSLLFQTRRNSSTCLI